MRANVGEVAVCAEVVAQASLSIELHAVEASVVIVDAHQHRTRGRGDEYQSIGVLGNDLLAA